MHHVEGKDASARRALSALLRSQGVAGLFSGLGRPPPRVLPAAAAGFGSLTWSRWEREEEG